MENQNLAIALALVSLVTGIALLVNWSSNRQVPGLLKIALGFMATCVGILLASMQEFIPPGEGRGKFAEGVALNVFEVDVEMNVVRIFHRSRNRENPFADDVGKIGIVTGVST